MSNLSKNLIYPLFCNYFYTSIHPLINLLIHTFIHPSFIIHSSFIHPSSILHSSFINHSLIHSFIHTFIHLWRFLDLGGFQWLNLGSVQLKYLENLSGIYAFFRLRVDAPVPRSMLFPDSGFKNAKSPLLHEFCPRICMYFGLYS